ncbi:MAG: amino acid transporter [Isosphaeraceae bacterium]|jgi:APA family basic amino acid/polyamine antiporter|nr:MAG: amino acid transporter [Isosphaeraceae bacterium]
MNVPASQTHSQLPRVLGPVAALSTIVGSVIGSGIFIVPARVARELEHFGLIALAWVVGGLFSLAGALTLSELAAMFPRAGGPYVYLREAYGRVPAFLFGWTEFLVVRSGSMATLAAAFALYASQLDVLRPPTGWNPAVWLSGLACLAMVVVAAVNVVGTRWGGALQVLGTVLKVGALLAMIGLAFTSGQAELSRVTEGMWPEGKQAWWLNPTMFRHFMVAMVGILWAYDGWVNTANLAEEIREPSRNLPRALILGTLVLIGLYLGTTLAYHLVLPTEAMAGASTEKGSSQAVSAVYMREVLGSPGVAIIAGIVMISTFISLNGNVLSGPRAYFALARDGLFPRGLAAIHPRYLTPARAIVAQTAWAITLTIAGTLPMVFRAAEGATGVLGGWRRLGETPLYDILYTYVIFGATLFYALAIGSVFVLRRKRPELERPYRTFGYPVMPMVFLVGAGILLGSMLVQQPVESLAGLGIVAAGLPVYGRLVRPGRRVGDA